MSWSSRFGGWASGRFSPFGNPGGQSHQVTDQDFSYITSDDLNELDGNQQRSGTQASHPPPSNNRPSRDTDILIFRHKKVSYPVHFAAYSIDDGLLTVGAAREQAAKKLEIRDARRIRMFYKGRNLKYDGKTCREEGLRSDGEGEILCVIGEVSKQDNDDDESGSDSVGSLDGAAASREGVQGKKKRKNRKRKSRKSAGGDSASDSGRGTPMHGNVEHLPIPSGMHPSQLHPQNGSSGTSRQPSPQPPSTPLTALEKLEAVAANFNGKLVPQCVSFMQAPPEEKGKRDYEHKKLTETILAQVLIKLDAVDTEGDEEARGKRKELVRDAQGWLNRLDAFMK